MQEEIESKALMAGLALSRGRTRSSIVWEGRSPEQVRRHASSCVVA